MPFKIFPNPRLLLECFYIRMFPNANHMYLLYSLKIECTSYWQTWNSLQVDWVIFNSFYFLTTVFALYHLYTALFILCLMLVSVSISYQIKLAQWGLSTSSFGYAKETKLDQRCQHLTAALSKQEEKAKALVHSHQFLRSWHCHKNPSPLCVDNTRSLPEEAMMFHKEESDTVVS